MSSNDPADSETTYQTRTGVDLREVAESLFKQAKAVALLSDSLRREAGLLSALCDHLGDYKGDGGDG
ncbi:MAG: hypothetical protein GY772_32520 [bacterium]|nr:hypothetical protein [bacterium]